MYTLASEIQTTVRLTASDCVTTQAQFADALLWCYGFHHELAHRQFAELIQRTPECALGYWGLAYSCAPFYNRPWSWFTESQKKLTAQTGFNALAQAESLLQNPSTTSTAETNLHRYLVENLQLLFRNTHPVDEHTFLKWQHEYAAAMKGLVTRYESHPDIVSLTAEAQLTCTPWQLWELRSGEALENSHVLYTIELIESCLKLTDDSSPQQDQHPGLLHMHIHALEMSAEPERSEQSAEGLRDLLQLTNPVPPHLPHMATHIDVLTGRYQQAIETNRQAAAIDRTIDQQPDEFYLISRLHNLHLMLYCAMLAGRWQDSLEAQRHIEQLTLESETAYSEDLLSVSIEGFYANRVHADIRFGQWQAAANATEQVHEKFAQSPYARALTSYAHAVALANLGERTLVLEAMRNFELARKEMPAWYLINNNPADNILATAQYMMEGEYNYHIGDTRRGLQLLRQAVSASDDLAYCEPWPWMHPPRHALGALLLDQKYIDEATVVYETDLGLNDELPRCLQHPGNVWALKGVEECYQRLGREISLQKIKPVIEQALTYADLNISSSCFCRHSQEQAVIKNDKLG